MSTIPLLPSMKDSCQIATGQPGEWRADSQTSLGSLVESLNVTAKEESNISSIPDIWARPAAFEMILFDKAHQMHQRFLNEWRGILAMLALREVRGINKLEVHSVVIPAPETLKPEDTALLQLFSRMLPDEYKTYKDPSVNEGVKLQVISYNDSPLAIIWPSLMICPAVEPRFPSNASISWWTFDGITDPLLQNNLNNDEKIILHQWLETLMVSIMSKNKFPDSSVQAEKIGNLLDLLDDYQKELKISSDEPNLSFIPATPLEITGFCSALGEAKTLEMKGESFLDVSDVLLEGLAGSDAKKLLVLTPDLPEQWKKSPSDITVAGSYSYETVYPKFTNSLNKNKVANVDLSAYDAKIWTADDFFTEKICVITPQAKPCFPDARINVCETFRGNKVNILLPLKEEVLQYLKPEYISNHIKFKTFSYEKEHFIEVDLTVQTSGGPISLKKTYKKSNNAKEESNIQEVIRTPMLQIWPNFQLPDSQTKKWNYYYTFYDNMAYNTFHAAPYWPKDKTLKDKTSKDNPFSRALETGRRTELVKGRTYPSAFICSIEEKCDDGDRTTQLGLILPNPPKKLTFSTPMKKARIGIDFGTTNTVAYIEIDGVPKLMKFHNYLPENPSGSLINNVIEHSQESMKAICQEIGRQNFIAMSEQPADPATSIRTIFHHHVGAMDIDTPKPLPLFQGNIYYQDSKDSILNDISMVKSLQTDEMKWDLGDPNGKQNRQSFLMELGMQCMAEALSQEVTDIEWFYSYPTSFTDNQRTSLEETWGLLIDLFKDIYPKISESAVSNSESIAMARYFADPSSIGAAINNGIVCLDIGGGSTDIAVWQGSNNSTDDIRAQASLRFAGKNIINEQLFKHPDLLKEFHGPDNSGMNQHLDKMQEAAENNDKITFNILLEAFLKYYEESIFSRLYAVKSSDMIKLLLRNITFSLSGIFCYSGMMVGDLRVTGNYDKSGDPSKYRHLPDCYVGGNGSKLLNWAAGGKFLSDSQANRIFKDAFVVGVNIGQNFKYRFENDLYIDERSKSPYSTLFSINCTERPKQEVAYGLVSPKEIAAVSDKPEENTSGGFDATMNGMAGGFTASVFSGTSCSADSAANSQDTKVIAGECYSVKGQHKSALSAITAQELSQKIVQVDEDLTIFKLFLTGFNNAAAQLELPPIELSDRDFYTIWRNVNQQLVNNSSDEHNIMVEPLFIMVLKECLKLI